ncbi:hypothetical protein IGI04_014639 [Brassica rapa subsp. trilocularis]|uniref:Uncharacterized protein n=1 Tax=Brassica rapa subsp. trilocularis TaxID=1813537 RepID=A0ABQ7MMX0_BRACM|nr:hypothetical protein IGI04_014639 [Brassica rapa subsp. trilocularis]
MRATSWCRSGRSLRALAPTGRSGSGATLVGRFERSLQGHLRLFGVMRTRATSWRRSGRSLPCSVRPMVTFSPLLSSK